MRLIERDILLFITEYNHIKDEDPALYNYHLDNGQLWHLQHTQMSPPIEFYYLIISLEHNGIDGNKDRQIWKCVQLPLSINGGWCGGGTVLKADVELKKMKYVGKLVDLLNKNELA